MSKPRIGLSVQADHGRNSAARRACCRMDLQRVARWARPRLLQQERRRSRYRVPEARVSAASCIFARLERGAMREVQREGVLEVLREPLVVEHRDDLVVDAEYCGCRR